MTPSRVIIVILSILSLALVGASSCLIQQAKIARGEVETMRSRVESLERENVEIREILARAYDAVNRASDAVEEAATGHAERIEKIDHANDDWLICPLPDGVRDAFRDDQDGVHNTAAAPARPMR